MGDVLSKFDYGLNSASSDYDGKNKYLRITDIDEQTHRFNLDNLTSPKVDLKNKDNYILHPGDIVFARTGASVGKTYKYREDDGRVYFAGFLIRGRINKNFDTSFIFDTTLLPKYSNFVKITSIRSGQPGINSEEYKKYVINIPTINEQKYISKLITNLEELIMLQQRKLENYLLIKKKLSNIFFNDRIVNKNDLLFEHRVKANQLFISYSKKGFSHLPVLSASQDKGMIFRKDESKNILYTHDNLTNYKLVEPDNFVVHLRSFQAGFAYSDKTGIASPAYTIFKFKNNVAYNSVYWKEKFKSYNFIQLLKKITYGVRDGRSISFSDFLSLYLTFPDIKLQNKIGNVLSKLDTQISDQKEIIKKLENIKQFLLQNMFI